MWIINDDRLPCASCLLISWEWCRSVRFPTLASKWLKAAVFASCMLMNLHACSRVCDASTVMLIGAGRGQTQHTWARTCVFLFPLSDRLLFDEPYQICCDVLSALFREHTAKRVQEGAAAGELKPADDARCMEENSPVSCSHLSSAINRTRGDSMSGAAASMTKDFLFSYLPSLHLHF